MQVRFQNMPAASCIGSKHHERRVGTAERSCRRRSRSSRQQGPDTPGQPGAARSSQESEVGGGATAANRCPGVLSAHVLDVFQGGRSLSVGRLDNDPGFDIVVRSVESLVAENPCFAGQVSAKEGVW